MSGLHYAMEDRRDCVPGELKIRQRAWSPPWERFASENTTWAQLAPTVGAGSANAFLIRGELVIGAPLPRANPCIPNPLVRAHAAHERLETWLRTIGQTREHLCPY